MCLASEPSSGVGGRRAGRRKIPHQKTGVEGEGRGEGVRKRRGWRLSGVNDGSGGGRGEGNIYIYIYIYIYISVL